MSYVGEPFRHDLFVSYSHGDVDGSDDSLLKRWSLAFARELESELRSFPRLTRDLKVFLDEHPRAGSGLTPFSAPTGPLQVAVSASAILTVLLSPHYLLSSWCRDERDWWVKGQEELGIPHAERVALARVWGLEEPDWPDVFKDARGEPVLGFWFHDRKRGADEPWPYEWTAPTPDSKGPFREELLRLVSWLVRKLDELKKHLDERRRLKETASHLDGGRDVYLYGRSDNRKTWDDVYRALDDDGFHVVPTDPAVVETDLVKAEEARRSRLAMLAHCDALLLLGSADGLAVDADLHVVGKHECNSARARSRRPIPCALLDTVGGPIATERRKSLARKMQIDWIDGTQGPWAAGNGVRPPWVPAVHRWLREKSAALREGL